MWLIRMNTGKRESRRRKTEVKLFNFPVFSAGKEVEGRAWLCSDFMGSSFVVTEFFGFNSSF